MTRRTMLALVAVGMAVVAVVPEATAGRDPNRVEGTVAAVYPTGVVIQTANGTPVSVTVGPFTKVERNGRRVPITAFKVGDRGQARLNPAGGPALKVEAVGP